MLYDVSQKGIMKSFNAQKFKKYLEFIDNLSNMSNEKVLAFYNKSDNGTIEHMFSDEFINYQLALDPALGSASLNFTNAITGVPMSLQEIDAQSIFKKGEFIIISTLGKVEEIKEKVGFIPFDKIFFQCGIRYINFQNKVSAIDSFIVTKNKESNEYNIFCVVKYPQENLRKEFCFHKITENALDLSEDSFIAEYEGGKEHSSPEVMYDGRKRFELLLNVIKSVCHKINTKQYRTYYKYENGRVVPKEIVYASEVKMHKRHFWEDSGKFIIPTLSREEILAKGYFIDGLVFKDGELRQNVPYTIIGNHIRNAELEKKNREIDLIKKRTLKCEEKIYSILRELYPDKLIRRHDRKTLKGIELDFNIPELRLGIEYDGEQHFDKELYEKLYGDGFEEQVKRDRLKDKLCKKKNITLIRIKYDEPLTKSHIKKRLK